MEKKLQMVPNKPAQWVSVLRPWQQIVIDQIDNYPLLADTESMQSMSDYERSRLSMIQVSLRLGSGHTFLTAHIAKTYPSTVIFFDWEHSREIEILGDIRDSDAQFHPGTILVSAFEIRHDIMLSNKAEWSNVHLDKLKLKFQNKQVVVIDRATEALQRFPEVIDFAYQVTQNSAIILLG